MVSEDGVAHGAAGNIRILVPYEPGELGRALLTGSACLGAGARLWKERVEVCPERKARLRTVLLGLLAFGDQDHLVVVVVEELRERQRLIHHPLVVSRYVHEGNVLVPSEA